MSDPIDFSAEMRKRRTNTRPVEEIMEEIRQSLKGQPPTRLELIINSTRNFVILQGNQLALAYLQDIFEKLSASDSRSGMYFLFDEYTSLTETNGRIKLQRVGDTDEEISQPSTEETPFRLELIIDSAWNFVLLQGNQSGLASLRDKLEMLAHPESANGMHFLLDEHTTLTKTNGSILLKRVGDTDEEPG